MGGYAKYWQNKYDRVDKPKWIDRTRRRQAEFLVFQKLKWDFIVEVATINSEKAIEVKKIFEKLDIPTPIKVKPEWYFECEIQ